MIVYILLVVIYHYLPFCLAYGRLNINDWLTEFESCRVHIITFEGIEDVGIFSYPVLLFDSKQRGILTATGRRVQFKEFVLRKRTFCAIQIFVVPEFSASNAEEIVRTIVSSNFCSKSVFGLVNHSREPALTNHKWTNCIFIFVLPEDGDKQSDVLAWEIILSRDLQLRYTYEPDVQLYLLNYKRENYGKFIISSMQYICWHCISGIHAQRGIFPVLWSVACSSPRCREEMEAVAETKTDKGHNTAAFVISLAPPYENIDNVAERCKTLTEKYRVPHEILILSQRKAFARLRSLTLREYYFNFRQKINFIRINQGILFEKVAKNISELLDFPNHGLEDFNPTSNTTPHSLETIASKRTKSRFPRIFVDSVPRGSSLFVTGETYFNFLTCHGFQKSAPLSAYLRPFDYQIWVVGISAMLFMTLILSATYLSFSTPAKKVHGEWPPVTSFLCYSFSVILENGFGKLQAPKRGRCVTNIIFIVLAFMSIILANLYKSIITTDMISPILGSIPYENFTQLRNFTLIAVTAKELQFTIGLNRNKRKVDTLGLRLNSDNLEFGLEDCCAIVKYLVSSNLHLSQYKFSDKDMSELIARFKFHQRIRVFEYEEDALSKLATCKKDAFVGSDKEIEEFTEFNRNRVKLMKGKVKFMPNNYYWSFPFSTVGKGILCEKEGST
jgi:hypothetical protein